MYSYAHKQTLNLIGILFGNQMMGKVHAHRATDPLSYGTDNMKVYTNIFIIYTVAIYRILYEHFIWCAQACIKLYVPAHFIHTL